MTNWFPYTQPCEHPQVRLFCFAHSGGVASLFKSWQKELPTGWEVYPVQLPGREGRFKEPLITSLDSLLEQLIPQLTPLMEVPSVFFGHSLGALIAFEAAKRQEPTSLVVSACCSPDLIHQTTPLHHLPDEEFISHLTEYGAMPRQLLENRSALAVLLPRLRADFKIFETYTPAHFDPVKCPILALGGKEDDLVSFENLQRWEHFTKGTFESHIFPGNHFYYLDAGSKICQLIQRGKDVIFNRQSQLQTSSRTARGVVEKLAPQTICE